MCGFFQVIQKTVPISREKFTAALNTLHHRGPDDQGVHYLDFNTPTADGEVVCHAAFGHQRLSILDLSDRSHQPFLSQDKVFLYNGELYNYRQIGAQLKKQGVDFRTTGDTEVFLRSVVSGGAGALTDFNGMWAFSLFDAGRNALFLSRDRYGKKPLFYYLDDEVLCVSSSIGAIKTYLGLNLEFRRSALLDYFLFGSMHPSASAETHFQKISQILPGHYCTFDFSRWEMTGAPYFDWHHPPAGSTGDYQQQDLVEVLRDSVASRLVSDRPVALLLSGGIDSSLLLSVLYSEKLQDQVKIFMGDTGRSDDYKYAQKCVQELGVAAETVVLDYDSNSFEQFLQVCLHHEKAFPFNGNAMAMPQMYEAIAQQGIPVVLDGTGGDELFGGYWGRQFQAAVRNAVRRHDWAWIKQSYACDGKVNNVRRHIRDAFWPARYLNAKQSLKTRVSAQLHPLLNIPAPEIWSAKNPDPLNDLGLGFTDVLCNDIAPGGRLGEWIWHNDRNAMMASVENRSPLLDMRLHPFVFSGYRKKYADCWNKHELRKAFDALQPLPTQWRSQKQGFRWDGKHFINNNRTRIMELIEATECLSDVVNTKRLLSLARKYPNILRSSLGKRTLCIAGLEQSLIKN